MMNEKPTLHLCDPTGKGAVDEMCAMFEQLTGRKPTESERKECEAAVMGKPPINVPPKNPR